MARAITSLFVGMFMCVSTADAASAQQAEKRTEALIEAFKKVKPSPDEGELSAADKKHNKKVFAELDSFFDYSTLTTAPLAPHKKSFTEQQMQGFSKDFRELIRLVAYPNSGEFFETAEYELRAKKAKGETLDVDMDARLPAQDIETTVTFHWKNKPSGLQIVDVSFDGSSLVKDYSNQFGRIIRKSGADGLVQKVEQRLQREREEAVVAP